MKKLILPVLAVAALVSACNKESMILKNDLDNKNAMFKTTFQGIDTIGGVVPAGQTLSLSSDTLYYLSSKLYVKGTLNIAAGTRILGMKKSTPAEATAIIICRGAQIFATGTAQKPIIMQPSTYPNAQPGDWGGVVIIGNGPTNRTNATLIEGINTPSLPSGVTTSDISYGGPGTGIATDNSGVFQYVRLEYPGALVTANNELNGLTCGGVGGFTTIDHIMITYGADDGFEFFGGNFNPKYLVSYGCNDDQFDFDHGYTGRIQFAVGHVGNLTAYSSDPNGIECDNDNPATSATPQTHPKISNMTLVGMKTQTLVNSKGLLHGSHWRRNATMTMFNSLILGFNRSVVLNGTISEAALSNFKYNVVSAFTGAVSNGSGTVMIPAANNKVFVGYDLNDANRWGTAATHIFLIDPFSPSANALSTGLEPKYGSLKNGAKFTIAPLPAGFDIVNFKGAVGNFADNWLLEDWVDFTP
jgi:hypothetical protein